MRVILLGAPGSGKGTQAKLISHALAIPHISTGDLLRQAVESGSTLGLQVKQKIALGELVSDDLVLSLVKERLQASDCKEGFILDGVPRTLAQAHALEKAGILVEVVVNIDVPDTFIIERITNRWVHAGSGRVYNMTSNPPKIFGKDDITGEDLVRRADDTEEVVAKRLAIYHAETEPVATWYAQCNTQPIKYYQIVGTGTVEAVHKSVIDAINAAS